MARLRWLLLTLGPPLIYLVPVYLATRPAEVPHKFANPTVMTVSEDGGPAMLHAPPAVYPLQALLQRVEGRVTLEVGIAADGTVVRARAIAGPAVLREAAIGNVWQWQFEAKAQETRVDVVFSLSHATRSFTLPEPFRRVVPRYRGTLRGTVRVVATVDIEGRVEFVQPVTGPEKLVAPAVEAVRRWWFRPMLRDGKPERGTVVVDVPFGP
jgi:TonB family protein